MEERRVNEQQWSRFLSRWDGEAEGRECDDSRFERAFQHPPPSDTRTRVIERRDSDWELLAQQYRQQRFPKSSYAYGYSDRCYPPPAEDRHDTLQRPPSEQRHSYHSEKTLWAKSSSPYETARADLHSQKARIQHVGGNRRFDDQRAHKLDYMQHDGPSAPEAQLSYRHSSELNGQFVTVQNAVELRQRYGRLAGQEGFRSDHLTPEHLPPHASARHALGPSTSTLSQGFFSAEHSRDQAPPDGQPPLKVQRISFTETREQECGKGTREKSNHSQGEGSNTALDDDHSGFGRQGPGARNPGTPANFRSILNRRTSCKASPEGNIETTRKRDPEPRKRQGVTTRPTAGKVADEKDQEDNSRPSSKSSEERCISPPHNERASNQLNHSGSNSGSNEPQDQEEVNLNTVARPRTQASLVIGTDPLVRSKRAGKRALLALAALEDEIVNPGPRDRMTEEDKKMHVKKSINLAVAAGKFAFIKMQEMLSGGFSVQGDAPSMAGNSVEGNNDDD